MATGGRARAGSFRNNPIEIRLETRDNATPGVRLVTKGVENLTKTIVAASSEAIALSRNMTAIGASATLFGVNTTTSALREMVSVLQTDVGGVSVLSTLNDIAQSKFADNAGKLSDALRETYGISREVFKGFGAEIKRNLAPVEPEVFKAQRAVQKIESSIADLQARIALNNRAQNRNLLGDLLAEGRAVPETDVDRDLARLRGELRTERNAPLVEDNKRIASQIDERQKLLANARKKYQQALELSLAPNFIARQKLAIKNAFPDPTELLRTQGDRLFKAVGGAFKSENLIAVIERELDIRRTTSEIDRLLEEIKPLRQLKVGNDLRISELELQGGLTDLQQLEIGVLKDGNQVIESQLQERTALLKQSRERVGELLDLDVGTVALSDTRLAQSFKEMAGTLLSTLDRELSGTALEKIIASRMTEASRLALVETGVLRSLIGEAQRGEGLGGTLASVNKPLKQALAQTASQLAASTSIKLLQNGYEKLFNRASAIVTDRGYQAGRLLADGLIDYLGRGDVADRIAISLLPRTDFGDRLAAAINPERALARIQQNLPRQGRENIDSLLRERVAGFGADNLSAALSAQFAGANLIPVELIKNQIGDRLVDLANAFEQGFSALPDRALASLEGRFVSRLPGVGQLFYNNFKNLLPFDRLRTTWQAGFERVVAGVNDVLIPEAFLTNEQRIRNRLAELEDLPVPTDGGEAVRAEKERLQQRLDINLDAIDLLAERERQLQRDIASNINAVPAGGSVLGDRVADDIALLGRVRAEMERLKVARDEFLSGTKPLSALAKTFQSITGIDFKTFGQNVASAFNAAGKAVNAALRGADNFLNRGVDFLFGEEDPEAIARDRVQRAQEEAQRQGRKQQGGFLASFDPRQFIRNLIPQDIIPEDIGDRLVENISKAIPEVQSQFDSLDERLGGLLTSTMNELGARARNAFVQGFGDRLYQQVTPLINQIDAAILNTLDTIRSIPGRFSAPLGIISQTSQYLAGLSEPLDVFQQIMGGIGAASSVLTNVGQQIFFITSGFATIQQIVSTGPIRLLITQNEELNQQLLATQSAIASTTRTFNSLVTTTNSQGNAIALSSINAVSALASPVRSALQQIREESLELVGVTSSQLVDVFQVVNNSISSIGGGLRESAGLTVDFTAALGAIGLPLYQARQEIGSILTGTIDQNSVLAKTLNISNEMIAKWKAQGTGISELTKRLAGFKEANKLAAQSIGGQYSNIVETIETAALAAGRGLIEPIVARLSDVFDGLTEFSIGKTGNLVRLVKKQITSGLTEVASDIFAGVLDLFDAIKNAFVSLLPVSSSIPSYLAKSFGNFLSAIADGINATVEILQPFVDFMGRLVGYIRALGGGFLGVAVKALVLQKGIQFLATAFKSIAVSLPVVGEFLFATELRLNGMAATFLQLLPQLERGGAGFITLGKSLQAIPGLAGTVQKALVPIAGPFAGMLTGLIPTVAALSVQGIALINLFPPLRTGFESILRASPAKNLSAIGAAFGSIADNKFIAQVPILGAGMNAIAASASDMASKLSANSVQLTTVGLLTEKFNAVLRQVGASLASQVISITFWGAALYLAARIVNEVILGNESLVETFRSIGAILGNLTSIVKSVVDVLIDALKSFGAVNTAIAVLGVGLVAFNRSAFVSTAIMTGLTAATSRVASALRVLIAVFGLSGASLINVKAAFAILGEDIQKYIGTLNLFGQKQAAAAAGSAALGNAAAASTQKMSLSAAIAAFYGNVLKLVGIIGGQTALALNRLSIGIASLGVTQKIVAASSALMNGSMKALGIQSGALQLRFAALKQTQLAQAFSGLLPVLGSLKLAVTQLWAAFGPLLLVLAAVAAAAAIYSRVRESVNTQVFEDVSYQLDIQKIRTQKLREEVEKLNEAQAKQLETGIALSEEELQRNRQKLSQAQAQVEFNEILIAQNKELLGGNKSDKAFTESIETLAAANKLRKERQAFEKGGGDIANLAPQVQEAIATTDQLSELRKKLADTAPNSKEFDSISSQIESLEKTRNAAILAVSDPKTGAYGDKTARLLNQLSAEQDKYNTLYRDGRLVEAREQGQKVNDLRREIALRIANTDEFTKFFETQKKVAGTKRGLSSLFGLTDTQREELQEQNNALSEENDKLKEQATSTIQRNQLAAEIGKAGDKLRTQLKSIDETFAKGEESQSGGFKATVDRLIENYQRAFAVGITSADEFIAKMREVSVALNVEPEQRQKALEAINEAIAKKYGDQLEDIKLQEQALSLAVVRGKVNEIAAIEERGKIAAAQIDVELEKTRQLLAERVRYLQANAIAPQNDAEVRALQRQIQTNELKKAELEITNKIQVAQAAISRDRQIAQTNIEATKAELEKILTLYDAQAAKIKNTQDVANAILDTFKAQVSLLEAQFGVLDKGARTERERKELAAIIAAIKLDALETEYAAQLKNLELEEQSLAIAREKQKIANQVAEIEARSGLIDAQSELALALADPQKAANAALIGALTQKVDAQTQKIDLVRQRAVLDEKSFDAQAQILKQKEQQTLLNQQAGRLNAQAQFGEALPSKYQQRKFFQQLGQRAAEQLGFTGTGGLRSAGRGLIAQTQANILAGRTGANDIVSFTPPTTRPPQRPAAPGGINRGLLEITPELEDLQRIYNPRLFEGAVRQKEREARNIYGPLYEGISRRLEAEAVGPVPLQQGADLLKLKRPAGLPQIGANVPSTVPAVSPQEALNRNINTLNTNMKALTDALKQATVAKKDAKVTIRGDRGSVAAKPTDNLSQVLDVALNLSKTAII